MPRKFIPRVPCVCEVCGKAFEVTQADARRGRGRRCSASCGHTKRHIPNRTCKRCGRAFYKNAYAIAHGGGLYCSNACQTRSRPVEPLWSRVWRRIDYGGPGCWEWTGGKDRKGYGLLSVEHEGQRRPRTVPRLVWFLVHGDWPIFCCHRCDNPACARPSHLFNGTPADNNRDMWSKGRGYRPKKRTT